MKNKTPILSKTTYFFYFLFMLVVLQGCGKRSNEIFFDISMQKINGEWIQRTYLLPQDAHIFIGTYDGSYSLEYSSDNLGFYIKSMTIKNGIIDYRINN